MNQDTRPQHLKVLCLVSILFKIAKWFLIIWILKKEKEKRKTLLCKVWGKIREAILELLFASVSKRVQLVWFAWKWKFGWKTLSCKNDFTGRLVFTLKQEATHKQRSKRRVVNVTPINHISNGFPGCACQQNSIIT